MLARLGVLIPLAAASIWGQTNCTSPAVYVPCDLVFEMTDTESKAHPNPYLTVELSAEVRSPSYKTIKALGFWDGGKRMIARFAPIETGEWVYRISSNLKSADGKQGKLAAAASDRPGFIQPANVHHWFYPDNLQPHLWMGDTCYRFATVDRALFEQFADARAAQKFNHLRGFILGGEDDAQKVFPSPDQLNPDHFRQLDERILYLNRKGIIADLILAADENHLVKLFPTWQQRRRYVSYVVSRYAAMDVTWQGVQEFEEYENGRALLKEIGVLLMELDPYSHPRSTHTVSTSAPLLSDKWMNYVVYQSSDDHLGSIEHQLYPAPFVNLEFAYEDSGAGRSHPHHVDTDTFRRRLWNATMNGQYPTFGNTGTYGGSKFPAEAKYLDSPGAKQMSHWNDFFSKTRHWELEPYFDVDGGRAVALEDVEYIVYLEKPGPVELLVRKRTYDVNWFNPITGQYTKQKDWKGERFIGQPPAGDHDWVLHLSREGRKEGMLRSYKFESRTILMQEVETAAKLVPFEIVGPSAEELSLTNPARFEVKVTRDTRATRSMRWLWTGDVVAGGQGYRVVRTGPQGRLRLPTGLAPSYPAVLHLRLYGMNLVGKVYSLDRVYRLIQ